MKNLIENTQVVEAVHPQTGGSAITGDYISMKKAGHVTVLCHINQGAADTIAITLEQATAVAGTGSKPIATDVPIFLVADAATSDLWVRQTDGVAYTTSAATKHKLVAFEVDAEDLDVAGGFDCLTVKFGASSASNLVSAQYVCSKLRYGPVSMIAD
jgi:hypothetical protein